MPSEYDFLSPYSRYSRSLRPAGRGRKAFLLAGAFAAGVVSTALIVGLPLQPFSADRNATATAQKQAPRPSESLTPTPPAESKVATNTPGDNTTTAPAKPVSGNVAQRPRETTGAAPSAAKPEPAPATAPTRTATVDAPTRTAAQSEPEHSSIISAGETVPQPRPRPLALNREPAPAESAANVPVAAPPMSAPAPAEKPATTLALPAPAVSEKPDSKAHKPPVPRTERAIATRTEPAEKPAVRGEASIAVTSAKPAPEKVTAEKPAPAASEKPAVAEKPVVAERPAAGEKPAASVAAVASRDISEAARSEIAPNRNGKRTAERQRGGGSYAARPDQRQRKVARTRDENDRREFVDGNGVRHIILSRGERSRVAADIGRDHFSEGGWRTRRFFIFGPADDDE